MASIVQLKKSSVVGKVPLTTDLDYGELALNYADGKLYYKKSDGTTIDSFQAGGGSIAVSDDTTTNSSYYPIFATATSGSLSSVKVSSTQFTFNPSNGYFRSGNIGINIAPGSTPLDINHIGALTFGLRVGDNATVTNATGIYMRTTSTATLAWGASGKLVFATSGGSVIRYTIGSTGQFGIGASEDYGTDGKVIMSTGATTAPAWRIPGTRVTTVATGTSITMNCDTTDIVVQVNTQAAGTLTINAPTGTPVDGQKIMLRLTSTNAQTFSWNAIFGGSTDMVLPTTSSGSSKEDYIGFIYDAISTKWHLIAKSFGY